MKAAFVLLVLVSVATTAPAPQRFRPSGNRNRGTINNVNAQVTNVNQNRPDTLSFNGGLALASSQTVGAFGQTISINQANAISQNIAIPTPGFGNRPGRFSNRRFG